jgi:hypothetical protein
MDRVLTTFVKERGLFMFIGNRSFVLKSFQKVKSPTAFKAGERFLIS